MKFNKIILILIFINLYSCADYKSAKRAEKKYYSSSGFVLIYEDYLYKEKIINKKINNEKLLAIHDILKINTPIKIINPDNSKSVEAKIYRKGNYPKIFNMVVTKEIATILDLDLDNPFVEIIEIKENETFIAKEGSIFDEEKNVADKAPVDEIKMDDITENKTEKKKKITKINNFILIVSDFYFEDSANNLKADLVKKINANNISVKKINDKKYRVLMGPFQNFNALKTTYISLNKLGFEGLNIYKK